MVGPVKGNTRWYPVADEPADHQRAATILEEERARERRIRRGPRRFLEHVDGGGGARDVVVVFFIKVGSSRKSNTCRYRRPLGAARRLLSSIAFGQPSAPLV